MDHIIIETKPSEYATTTWKGYFGGRRIAVLDIETTGLDRRRNQFVLGGLLDLYDGALHQIFADDAGEEAQALEQFMDLVHHFDVVVTYNGRHFDMPFLQARMEQVAHRNRFQILPDAKADRAFSYDGYNLDLYQVVNGHSPIRRMLPNLKQKTLENYMGLWHTRTDEISGAESVQLYMEYMRTKDPEHRRQILLHNSDDVKQLARLLPVVDKSDFHKAMYAMGFPVGPRAFRWQIRRIRFHKNLLMIEGQQGNRAIEYVAYQMGAFPAHIRFDAAAGSFHMEIPITRSAGIAAVDLRAAGLEESFFEKYPGFGSGFLVLEDRDGVKYREVNHFVRAFIMQFRETAAW